MASTHLTTLWIQSRSFRLSSRNSVHEKMLSSKLNTASSVRLKQASFSVGWWCKAKYFRVIRHAVLCRRTIMQITWWFQSQPSSQSLIACMTASAVMIFKFALFPTKRLALQSLLIIRGVPLAAFRIASSAFSSNTVWVQPALILSILVYTFFSRMFDLCCLL